MNTKERIKSIQARLGLQADGIIGPATLTAIEDLLDKQAGTSTASTSLTCSLDGLGSLVRFEISSAAYYNRHLKNPTWPGGASGVTIGIGYDLGYVSAARMRMDWQGKMTDKDLKALEPACRLKGEAARAKCSLASIRSVQVSLESARQVFYFSSLPAYAARCLKAYPGVDSLPADAQSALLSLVFNRGTRKSGSSRREMKALETLVMDADLGGIAQQILGMKRLWEGKGLDGLLRRREREAALVAGAEREYEPAELVRV